MDTFNLPIMYNYQTLAYGFVMNPGSVCSGTDGYCDILSKCRAFDGNSVVSELVNLLKNTSLTDLLAWFKVS